MSLAESKILVTGATGFIGGHLVRRLRNEQGIPIRALVRNPAKAQGLARLGVELARGDLSDYASLERAVEGCPVVIHAAAQVASVPDVAVFEQSNVRGTENLVRASSAARVERFVYLSSIAVFGLPTSGEIMESSPRRHCGDPYCDSKLDAENMVWRYQREAGLRSVILRPSGVYGPGSTHWSIVPLKRVRKGKMFFVNGGRGRLNYVYIDNLVDAILAGVEDHRAVGDSFIVNDGATTWREFYSAYARMAGKNRIRSVPLWVAKLWVHYRNLAAAWRGETTRVPPNALGFLVGSAVYNQSHLEEKLGFRSRVSLKEGMRRTEAWFRAAGLLSPSSGGE